MRYLLSLFIFSFCMTSNYYLHHDLNLGFDSNPMKLSDDEVNESINDLFLNKYSIDIAYKKNKPNTFIREIQFNLINSHANNYDNLKILDVIGFRSMIEIENYSYIHSLNLSQNEKIIDIEAIDENSILFIVSDSKNTYAIVFDIKNNVIKSQIKR